MAFQIKYKTHLKLLQKVYCIAIRIIDSIKCERESTDNYNINTYAWLFT